MRKREPCRNNLQGSWVYSILTGASEGSAVTSPAGLQEPTRKERHKEGFIKRQLTPWLFLKGVISSLVKLLGDDKPIRHHHTTTAQDTRVPNPIREKGATFAVWKSVGARHAAVAAQPRHFGPAAALPRLLVTGAVQRALPGALAS